MKLRSAVMLFAALAVSFLSIQAAGAQLNSAGGCDATFAGATATDSDGDGVSNADELTVGTNPCDPAEAPSAVCGDFVVGYNPSIADSDGDTFTDAVEAALGTCLLYTSPSPRDRG